jgi:hypothetical protein
MSDTFEWNGWKLRNHSLFLEGGEAPVFLYPNDLLLAIDETGIEDFSDPNYPLFGLGGCAVLAGQYFDAIDGPWTSLKEQHFGSTSIPLHAAELRGATPAQIAAIGEFFRNNHFFRLAALVTDKTELPYWIPPYQAVAMTLMQHLAGIATIVPFRRVGIIFESSQRTDRLAWNTF